MTYPKKVHNYYAHNQESGAWSTSDYFVRGLVTAGCLAVVRAGRGRGPASENFQKALKKAVQGGVAVAAGHYAAKSWRNGEVGSALVATALGAAGVFAAEKVLPGPVMARSRAFPAVAPLAGVEATEGLDAPTSLAAKKAIAKKTAAKKAASKKVAAKRAATKKTARKTIETTTENNAEVVAEQPQS